ncbi:ATP-grasp domain-containing protein [Nocardia sp. NPDC051756]|uniref:ATP-grasp domain-containing protein n=1 Tax=Nocardia sp. NPDC051756 TaxID=3154751 RepID=UPI00344AC7CD
MLLLVPADVLRPRRVDEHFAAEAEVARAAGMEVALVDHDALTEPDGAERAVRAVGTSDTAWYRGWMLRSEQYAAFAAALRRRGVTLRTGPEQYRRAHELPGWHSAVADVTPRAAWTDGADRAEFDRARAELGSGPAVLRDYTKSMKHYWNEAVFIPELDDSDTAWRVALRFLELRGSDLTGGFVLRRFEHFRSAEIRTWWIDGTCTLISPHPDTPQDQPAPDFDPTPIAPLIANLRLPFLTADFALREDGVWRLIEIGDGQVSDRPESTPPEALITLLHNQFRD